MRLEEAWSQAKVGDCVIRVYNPWHRWCKNYATMPVPAHWHGKMGDASWTSIEWWLDNSLPAYPLFWTTIWLEADDWKVYRLSYNRNRLDTSSFILHTPTFLPIDMQQQLT